MNKKKDIAFDWLRRYTGTDPSKYGDWTLLTNFHNYVEKFAERFGEHRGYVIRKELDQVCGEHFNQSSHKYEDMLPVIIEEIFPKNDSFLRLRREKYWINQYEAKDFGANRKS